MWEYFIFKAKPSDCIFLFSTIFPPQSDIFSLYQRNSAAITNFLNCTAFYHLFCHRFYKVDHRREPDEHRFKKFHKGWQDSISNKDKSYTANTLKKLTWQNLGYRFGKHFGSQTPEYIREVFDYLAQRYEKDAKSIVWSPVSGEDRLLQSTGNLSVAAFTSKY
jgi:hypothetical protein